MTLFVNPTASLQRLAVYPKPYLGGTELAGVLAISRPAITQRRNRGSLPAHDMTIGKVRMWEVNTIRLWLTNWPIKERKRDQNIQD